MATEYKLSYTANEINEKIGKIDEHSEQITQLDNEIVVERSRITNLATLQDGSTTGDAELIDIRTGYDGTLYDSAGEAVRGQVGAIEEAFDYMRVSNNILDPSNSESGDFSRTAANLVVGQELVHLANSGRVRSIDPFPIPSGTTTVYIRTSIEVEETASSIYIYCLDSQRGYISTFTHTFKSVVAAGSVSSILPADCVYIHVVVAGVSSGHDFSKVCISYEQLNAFEQFTNESKRILKESVLPDGFSGLPEQVYNISEQISVIRPKLHGKTVVNFGDSIFGKRRPPDDISTKLAELTGAIVHNCGFSGCTMAKHGLTNYDPFSMYRLVDEIVKGDDDTTKWVLQDDAIANATGESSTVPSYFSETLSLLKSLDFSDVDIITIAYGTNDLTRWHNLEKADNLYDTETFAGALRYSIETLLSTYPHLKIFICSQTFRFWVTDGEVTNTSDSYINDVGIKLTDIVAKTEEVASEYHLPYINNYDIGMNLYNRSYYFSATDGTHPLTVGCHLIAENMAKELF